MSVVLLTLLIGIVIILIGWYESKISAMVKNPPTRTRIVPRTEYDDVMGIDWVSEGRRPSASLTHAPV